MYVTVRRYGGNAAMADTLASRKDEVVELMGGVSGLKGYYLFSADGDMITVTITEDESGAKESSEVAAGWIRENMPEYAGQAPEISAGEVLVTT
jgi:hypothetical protein